MYRLIVRNASLSLAIFSMTTFAAAANKSKPSAPSVDSVQKILESETESRKASFDRRDELKADLRPATDSNSAWWQSGYIPSGKEWLMIEDSVVSGTEAALLNEYRELRTKLSTQPHGHWQLATWCRKNGLFEQERFHLFRVLLANDPSVDKDVVCQRLGSEKIGNSWVSKQERQEAARFISDIDSSHQRWDTKLETAC